MTGFLLDTNAISLLAPTKAKPVPGFAEWVERRDFEGKIFLSAVSIHEMQRGIHRLDAAGAVRKAEALKRWLLGLIEGYDEKILPVALWTAILSGQAEAAAIGAGRNPGMADALIAGTAREFDLIVVTDNLGDFIACGMSPLRPIDAVGQE
ncbi:PIN domain-containing protein [Jiella avicenniae]|uniref:PIN domain-containing protein n=1 Tax=Jiella avicenniae TaxID=2907202 RepID=A0A9X1P0Y3_9HYPH|nr:PIN domain-containing protein [Jiella avicenniae]MCE7027318.1 PIN domain-containing protein [Jiella avicenniae]